MMGLSRLTCRDGEEKKRSREAPPYWVELVPLFCCVTVTRLLAARPSEVIKCFSGSVVRIADMLHAVASLPAFPV